MCRILQKGYTFIGKVEEDNRSSHNRAGADHFHIKLYDDGYSYSTIASIRGVVKPAFQMAYTEDIIRRNPFEFRLDIIPNNTQKRVALSPKQQE